MPIPQSGFKRYFDLARFELHRSKAGDEADIGGIAPYPDDRGMGEIGHAGRIDQMPGSCLGPVRAFGIGEIHSRHRMKILRRHSGSIACDIARRNGRRPRQRDEQMREVAADPFMRGESVGRGRGNGAGAGGVQGEKFPEDIESPYIDYRVVRNATRAFPQLLDHLKYGGALPAGVLAHQEKPTCL